jgi:putative hydrolase of HD superfamily
VRTRLLETLRLKALRRAGWLRVGVPNPESVAAHSWGVAWLVLALAPDHLDVGHAASLAVIHDLAEVRVGDITPHDDVPADTKHAAETEAFHALTAPLPRASQLAALWQELAARTTAEARFVHACDKLDMALQAEIYAEDHAIDATEFIESALARLSDPDLAALDPNLAGLIRQGPG